MNLIECKEIEKSYGEGKEKVCVLNRITMSISEGEFIAIMGPSGTGKSTLLYSLCGLDTIDKGEVSFMGKNLSKLSEIELAAIRRTQIGFVFQQPTLLSSLNLFDNILLPILKEKGDKRRAQEERARMLMRKVGIEGLEERSTAKTSGGQLQRVGICRALMNEPKIVFADEPTGALNSKASSEIMDIFAQINKEGTAILMVTHDAFVASRSNRVLFLKDGKIMEDVLFNREDSIKQKMEVISEKMKELEI